MDPMVELKCYLVFLGEKKFMMHFMEKIRVSDKLDSGLSKNIVEHKFNVNESLIRNT